MLTLPFSICVLGKELKSFLSSDIFICVMVTIAATHGAAKNDFSYVEI